MEGSASGEESAATGHDGSSSGHAGDTGDRGGPGSDSPGSGSPGSGSGPGADDSGGRGADDAGSFADAKRFLSFVNAKKGSDLHWVVIPFSVILSGRSCCGSVRFLLDLERSCVRETRITCLDGMRCWDFTLAEGTCVYDATPRARLSQTLKFSYIYGRRSKDRASRRFFGATRGPIRAGCQR